ncbi:MAG: LPS export ABC transporter periplasmic protein LptC [Deltaproteobacteria bacterium]|nr:LPS export ABC transporter periplasmic protein LptC [Deltaproteobacteria bacterium]
MRARKIAIYIFSGIVVLTLLSSFYFFLRKPQKLHTPKISEKERRVVEIRDAVYTGEKDGKVDLRLKAKLARKYLDRNDIEMEEIEGTYISEKKGPFTFMGERGVLDTEKQTGILYGFTAKIHNEYEVKTGSISFNLKDGSAFGEEAVFIKGQKLSLKGVGIRGELKQGKFTLLKDVSGSIKTDKDAYAFESDSLTYDRENSIYILTGGVKADKSGMRIKCNRMHIYADNTGVRKVEAFGNTEMLSKGTVAKSDKALYDFNQKKVVFFGKVYVKKEEMELKGDIIEYYFEEGRFTTSSPKVRIKRNGY